MTLGSRSEETRYITPDKVRCHILRVQGLWLEISLAFVMAMNPKSIPSEIKKFISKVEREQLKAGYKSYYENISDMMKTRFDFQKNVDRIIRCCIIYKVCNVPTRIHLGDNFLPY